MKKVRLDHLIQERYPEFSKRQIQSWIMQGKVNSEGKILDKPGMQVRPDIVFVMNIETPKYVSRAGFKLEKALDHFGVDLQDKLVLDAGLSTGGFTDCLLQHGAKHVFGIDVGYGQVHDKIARDSRVTVFERTNLRHIDQQLIGTHVDLVTLDLSFISVLKVMDAIDLVLKPGGNLILLIKPQFEARKEQVGKGGIIKDPAVHQQVIERITQAMHERHYRLLDLTESPILGAEGNKEFLAYFEKEMAAG